MEGDSERAPRWKQHPGNAPRLERQTRPCPCPKGSQLPNSVKVIRERAASLFDTLASSWNCTCTSSHYANLLLEDPDSSTTQSNNRPPRQNDNLALWFTYKMKTEKHHPGLPWRSHYVKVCTIPAPSPAENTSNTHVSVPSIHEMATTETEEDKLWLKRLKISIGLK